MPKYFTRFIAVMLLLNLGLSSSASAQLTKLKAAYSAESSWSLATWVAYDGGFFKKYGPDVDLVLIRSAATITAALLAGEAPMIQLPTGFFHRINAGPHVEDLLDVFVG